MDKKITKIGLTSTRKNMILGLLLVLMAVIGTVPCQAQRNTIPMTLLRGYIVKDSNFSRKDFNVWLVTTQLTFDSLFTSIDVAMPKPDFNDHLVLAIKAETDNFSYKTQFRQMYVQRRILKVFFNVAKEKKDDEGAGWVSIVTIPKDKTIRRVNFYYDDMMIKTIPVVIVY